VQPLPLSCSVMQDSTVFLSFSLYRAGRNSVFASDGHQIIAKLQRVAFQYQHRPLLPLVRWIRGRQIGKRLQGGEACR